MVDFRNPGKAFCGAVSPEIRKALALGIFEAYGERDSRSMFPDAQMHDAWPIMRRGLIEARLATIASAHPALTCSIEKNAAGSSYFVRIEAGPIVIIQSKVDSPTEIPRPAVYREELAQVNAPCLPGFEDLSPPPSPDAKLCAMIIHGPDPDRPDRPGFIDVVFPTPDGKGQLGERVHILADLDLLETTPPATEEKVEDDLSIGFRDDIAKEDTA